MSSSITNTSKTEMNAPAWAHDYINQNAKMAEKGAANAQKMADDWFNPQAGSWQDSVKQAASGQFLKDGNPYYRQRLENEINSSNDDVQRVFAGAGRMGSAADTNALAQNSNNMRLKGLEDDYNRAFNNMLGSQQFMFGAQNQALGNQINPTRDFINRLTGQTTTTTQEKDGLSNALEALSALANIASMVGKFMA